MTQQHQQQHQTYPQTMFQFAWALKRGGGGGRGPGKTVDGRLCEIELCYERKSTLGKRSCQTCSARDYTA